MASFLPSNEPERIAALRRYRILDTPPEPAFDRLASLTAELLRAPIAMIALVNEKRTWVKAAHGIAIDRVSREASFAARAILHDDVFSVADAREDPLLCASPLVTGPAGVRSAACAPMSTADGMHIGSLCVFDHAVRCFDSAETGLLARLAQSVMDLLELRTKAVLREPTPTGLAAAAYQSFALGVSITDENGVYVDVNPAYCQLSGYTREELAGKPFTVVLPVEDREAAARAHGAFLEYDEPTVLDARLLRKDGCIIHVQCTVSRLVSETGQKFRVTTATDVTAVKQIEEQLREAEKMAAVSRLAGGAAHGFNNLLTIITGYSQLLRSTLTETHPLYSYADEISKAADRAASLTGKLLAFSRRRMGDAELLDLNGVVASVAGVLRPQLAPGVVLMSELAESPAWVVADRNHIEQCIRDLVANACEAMPRGGRITFRTSNVVLDEEAARRLHDIRSGEYVVLTIADTGEGIDAETRKHLFEPFFTTKGVGKGTGLATLYGTVKQVGGDVTIDSNPGAGTSVSVYLPAAR